MRVVPQGSRKRSRGPSLRRRLGADPVERCSEATAFCDGIRVEYAASTLLVHEIRIRRRPDWQDPQQAEAILQGLNQPGGQDVMPGTELQLGPRIRSLRQARHETLRELAERAGVTESFLSQVEREVTSPSIASVQRIARALDLGIAELFADDEP